jgi:hypothetical protein
MPCGEEPSFTGLNAFARDPLTSFEGSFGGFFLLLTPPSGADRGHSVT